MTELKSLDPRMNRLGLHENVVNYALPVDDQFQTFEAFQKVKENKPFEHTGIVHAPDTDIAFLFAKEQYSRRGNACLAMAIIPTNCIFVSEYTEDGANALDAYKEAPEVAGDTSYEIFILKKRGKQHTHLCTVTAGSMEGAIQKAANEHYITPCFNVWVAESTNVLFSSDEDRDIWHTLHEKKYREAIAYKSSEKIDQFKKENNT